MATTQSPDLLDPTTPKKKPAATMAAGTMAAGVQGPSAGGSAAPSQLDTGVPPPVAGDTGGTGAPTPDPVPPPAPTPLPPPIDAPPPGSGPSPIDEPPPPPGTPAPPGPTGPGVTPQQGVAQLNQRMMARFNRVLTPQEVQGLAQQIGPPQGPNGTYTAQQFAMAQDLVERYSGDINNPFPAGAPPPGGPPGAPPPAAPAPLGPGGPNAPTPTTPVTVEQGLALLNNDAALRIGRPLNQAEINGLSQLIGPPQGPNGTYTPQQLQAARDWVARYSGDINNPWGPLSESAPGSTTNLANTRLGELLNLSYKAVDPNSQAIQQPLGAFRSAQSRATDRARMAMALRNQREGIAGGGEEAGLLGLLEEQGQNEAGFEANLYVQELTQQRKQLSDAIQLATQAGLQNKARELQAELGKLDIELRRELGRGQLALGAQQLSQQDRQFLESMGFNYANLQGQLNNQAINALLGG